VRFVLRRWREELGFRYGGAFVVRGVEAPTGRLGVHEKYALLHLCRRELPARIVRNLFVEFEFGSTRRAEHYPLGEYIVVGRDYRGLLPYLKGSNTSKESPGVSLERFFGR